MSEFVDVGTLEHAAPYRRQPHHQVAGWQGAYERARGRREINGLLRFVPYPSPAGPAHTLLGLPRRRPILPFVRKVTLTVGLPPPPASDAA